MSCRTCSNSKPRVSIAPAAIAQNMNASSGSGLWPRRISIQARLAPAYTGAVANARLSDAIQDYLKEIYKLGVESERVSTSALAGRQQVSAASPSAMVKKLAGLRLAEQWPDRGRT